MRLNLNDATRFRYGRAFGLVTWSLGLLGFVACGDDVEMGANGSAASGGSSSGTGGTNADGSSGTSGTWTGIAQCLNHTYECGDTVDNDDDGLVDADDPDCLGVCDDTEGSYYGGIPGQAGPACTVDCYFDQDSGSGNDQCYWNHSCDPLAVADAYPPEGLDKTGKPYCEYDKNANTPGTDQSCDQLYATQLAACENYCAPLTPNGCDCFGCCELPAGSGKYVWLGSEDADGNGTCKLDVVNDPTKCQPCTPVAACRNHCETCELCIGKTSLPPECFPEPDAGTDAGIPGQCPAGVQPCGLSGQDPCETGKYCVTGCCIAVPT